MRSGLVRLNGTRFQDNAGEFFALGCWLLPGGVGMEELTARGSSRASSTWSSAASTTCACSALLGPAAPWDTRTVDPRWTDYEEVIVGTTNLIAAHGMRTQWTIFGGVGGAPNPFDRVNAIDTVAKALLPRQTKVAYIEIANESWQDGFYPYRTATQNCAASLLNFGRTCRTFPLHCRARLRPATAKPARSTATRRRRTL